jgi:hypothetical protein
MMSAWTTIIRPSDSTLPHPLLLRRMLRGPLVPRPPAASAVRSWLLRPLQMMSRLLPLPLRWMPSMMTLIIVCISAPPAPLPPPLSLLPPPCSTPTQVVPPATVDPAAAAAAAVTRTVALSFAYCIFVFVKKNPPLCFFLLLSKYCRPDYLFVVVPFSAPHLPPATQRLHRVPPALSLRRVPVYFQQRAALSRGPWPPASR